MKFKHLFKIPLFGFLFTLTTSYAQIGQGSIRIGPDISFSNSKLEIDGLNAKFKQSNLNAGITGGYYVIDNLEIGVSLGLLSNKSKVESLRGKTIRIHFWSTCRLYGSYLRQFVFTDIGWFWIQLIND